MSDSSASPLAAFFGAFHSSPQQSNMVFGLQPGIKISGFDIRCASGNPAFKHLPEPSMTKL
jgi:hypothetical protein